MFTIYDYIFEQDNHTIYLELEVTHFNDVEPHKGSAWTCDSSDDYYGYTEIDWDVYTYSVEDENENVVAEGSGDLPLPFYINSKLHNKIEDYLIECMKADQDLF
jgi:hypothetical protein